MTSAGCPLTSHALWQVHTNKKGSQEGKTEGNFLIWKRPGLKQTGGKKNLERQTFHQDIVLIHKPGIYQDDMFAEHVSWSYCYYLCNLCTSMLAQSVSSQCLVSSNELFKGEGRAAAFLVWVYSWFMGGTIRVVLKCACYKEGKG